MPDQTRQPTWRADVPQPTWRADPMPDDATPTLIPNRPTMEGYELGVHLARFADAEMAKRGLPDERCKSCAFRTGTVPNGSVQSLMDAVKCLIEQVPFMCHERPAGEEPTELCAGFALLVKLDDQPGQMPWPFSDEAKQEPTP